MTRGEKSVVSSALLAMTFRHQPLPNKGSSPDGISQLSLQASALWSSDHFLAFFFFFF